MANKNKQPLWIAGIVLIVAAAMYGAYHAGQSSSSDIPTYGQIQTSLPPQAPNPGTRLAQSAQNAHTPGGNFADAGDRHFENRQYSEAIAMYRKALAQNPKDADTHNDLGLALFYTGKKEEGIKSIRAATKADPLYQISWLSLGFTLSSVGKIDEANKALKTAIAINPTSPQGLEAKKMLFRNLSASPTKQ